PGSVPGREGMARPGAVPDGRKGADARVPPARATSTSGGEVEAAAAAGVVGAGEGGCGPSPAVRAAEARGHDDDGCAGRPGGAPLGASALPVRFVREGRDPLRGVNYSYSNAVQATRPPETAPDFAAGSAAGQRCRPPATAVRGGRLGGGPSRSVRRPGRPATAAVWPASLPYRPFPGPVAYRTGHHCVGPIHRCGGQVSVLFPAMTSELPPPPAPAAPPGAGVDLTSRA